MEAGCSSNAVYNESDENETDFNMDLTPKRSNEGRDGFACYCVPHCYNNSKIHNTRFYVIPSDVHIRAAWLSNVERDSIHQ